MKSSSALPGQTSRHRQGTRDGTHPDIDVPPAVCWFDGMPLAAQHFQTAARRSDRQLDAHLGLVAPYHYGAIRLSIDRGRLSGGDLFVRVQAVMPDHMIIDTINNPLKHRLDPNELRKKSQNRHVGSGSDLFRVYVAVPWEYPGRAAAGALPRFRIEDGDGICDDTTGDNELPIRQLLPNTRLVVDVVPPTDSVWLQIAELRLDGEAFSITDYVPPLLTVTPDWPLFSLCSDLVERVRGEANRLAQRLNALSKSAQPDRREELSRQIYHLTAALPQLETVLYTEQSHPYPVYLALANVLGHLSPLGKHPVPAPLFGYHHNALRASFDDADTRIRRVIREGIQESFEEFPFELDSNQSVFALTFRAAWTRRTVVLAVRAAQSSTPDATNRWMAGAVIESQGNFENAVAGRSLGVVRERFESKTGDLVPTRDELLFELKRLTEHFTRDETMWISNPSPKTGEKPPFQVVLYVEKDRDAW